MRTIVALTCILSGILSQGSGDNKPSYPFYDFDIARKHEINPHRRTIPLEGVSPGFNQLRLERAMALVRPTRFRLLQMASCSTVENSWMSKEPVRTLWTHLMFVASQRNSSLQTFILSTMHIEQASLIIPSTYFRLKSMATKKGSWIGMPAVVTELENEVDTFARTKRWIGSRKY
jgi:hypothetical protein